MIASSAAILVWIAIGGTIGALGLIAADLISTMTARVLSRPPLADLSEFERGDCRCVEAMHSFHSPTYTSEGQPNHGA
jgi:hypothetical protein